MNGFIKMKKRKENKWLYWSPRIFGIIFILFISVFALDVFAEYSGLELAVAFIMHMVPSFVLITALVIAWKFELAGAFIFLVLGILSAFFFNVDIISFLIVSLPALVVSALFFIKNLDFSKK